MAPTKRPTRSEWLRTGLGNYRWVFILGCPRSGTTFTLNAFAALTDVCATSSGVFPSQMAAIYRNAQPQLRQAIQFSLAFSVLDYVQRKETSRGEVIAECLRGDSSIMNLRLALPHSRRFTQKTDQPGHHVTTLLYKEPFLTFAPDLIEASLPSCSILFLSRDGRDAADSAIRTYNVLTDDDLKDPRSNEVTLGRWRGQYCVPWWVEEDHEDDFLAASPYCRAAWMWRSMVRTYLPFLARAEPSGEHKITHCRYEDLVADPLSEGMRILQNWVWPAPSTGGLYVGFLVQPTNLWAYTNRGVRPNQCEPTTSLDLNCSRWVIVSSRLRIPDRGNR